MGPETLKQRLAELQKQIRDEEVETEAEDKDVLV
jgi:hypothetical protein